MAKDASITVRVEPEIKRRVVELARVNNRALSNMVDSLLKRALWSLDCDEADAAPMPLAKNVDLPPEERPESPPRKAKKKDESNG